MTDDIEDVFGLRTKPFTERLGRPRPDEPPASDEPGIYKPYGFMPMSGLAEACEVRRWMDGTDIPEGIVFQYRFLMQIGFVGEEELRLYLPDCIVMLEGRHLGELREKLARRQVTFIQEFSARVWPSAPNVRTPTICRIAVDRPDRP